MRAVFMGTPDFAASILERLCLCPDIDVVAVYCQPDRPAGRGHKVLPPPVKVRALERGLPVYQPVHFREQEKRDALAALQPDILAVAAYGLILPQSVLDIPRCAPVNVHASLLPAYRGAAPIQRALMDGCAETGVSIMRMEAGLDSGPVYARRSVSTLGHTSGSLHGVLADTGGQLLLEVLAALREGREQAVAQEHESATHAPKLRKEEGRMDWARPASVVDAHIRAVTPWPGARSAFISPENTMYDLRIAPGLVGPERGHSARSAAPGEMWRLDDGSLAVATSDRFYQLSTVRPQNKKDMSAVDFAHGYLGRGAGPLARACALGSTS